MSFVASRARAPGKLVLSGSYSVLEGAPAIVAAIDRYAIADGARDATLVTPEVAAAIARGALDRAPAFDASELRVATPSGSRKLGVGSSAAILVASIAARSDAPDDELGARVFGDALAAHRAAQGGGSGVDVAASAFGGVLRCELAGEALTARSHELPRGLCVEVFSSPVSAKTSELVARARAAPSYARLVARAGEGARAAVASSSIDALVDALERQVDALDELGRDAGAAIVTDDVRALRPLARDERASFGPSGAGGGDVSIFVGRSPSSDVFRRAAAERGLELVALRLGARGVHRLVG